MMKDGFPMRATAIFVGAFLALSAGGCAEEGSDSGPSDASADGICYCRTGYACVGDGCEPTGNWSLYVTSASIAGTHRWDDTPVMAEWPPDPVVCATSKKAGEFALRCTPARTNTPTPTWTSSSASNGHLLGVAAVDSLRAGFEITLHDDDSGANEIMCTMTVVPKTDDWDRPLTATCLTGLAKDSSVELVLRPGG